VISETTRSFEAGEPFKMEYRVLAKDGRVVWLHDVASVVSRDEQGRATRYQGVQLDITSRKEAEHAQRRVVEELQRLDRMLTSHGLSAREIEVAQLLALGHTNAEMAATLHLSVRTVEHHRASVFRKLRVHSRAALVSEMREGLSREADLS
jgi:DNA-binding CsgD family transcriptional regulator